MLKILKKINRFLEILMIDGGVKAKWHSLDIPSYEQLIKIKHYFGEINTILDVGANIGLYSEAAKYIFPNSTIYSFEPVPYYYEIMKIKLKNKNINLFNLGLGCTLEQIEINVDENSGLSSSFLGMNDNHIYNFPDHKLSEKILVKVDNIDNMIEENRLTLNGKVLLKIDVQGYEEFVIKGAIRNLDFIHLISLELSIIPLYNNQKIFNEIVAILDELGYNFYCFWDTVNSKVNNRPLQVNVLFNKRGL